MLAGLRKQLERWGPLTEAEFARVQSGTTLLQSQSGEYLLENGHFCKHIYFVISGCIQMSLPRGPRRERIIQIALEDTFIADCEYFLEGRPSRFDIQALEDSTVAAMDRGILDHGEAHLSQKTIHLLQRLLAGLQLRLTALQLGNAKHKFQFLVQQEPELLLRLSEAKLAAYLEIPLHVLRRLKGDHPSPSK
jgi:CRP-like cAMP-binding protein